MLKKQRLSSDLLKYAEEITSAALNEVSPQNLIKDKIFLKQEQLFISGDKFDLKDFKDIIVVAFGKSAPEMAESMIRVLGNRIKGGICVSQKENQENLSPLTYVKASHPLPDLNSVKAAQKILSLAQKMSDKDLLIVLISGGGSSHVCLPPPEVSLKEKRSVIKNLLHAGAGIKELNTVRKHVSLIKGGRLARAAFPASVISLYISDVIGNDLETIASGPTHWDSSTYQDSVNILKKHHLWEFSPESIKKLLEKGMKREVFESVKKGDPTLRKTQNYILGGNQDALRAAAAKASQIGFNTSILSSSEQGEARERAQDYFSFFLNIREQVSLDCRPICLLSGGELTVTVKGRGKGGRNQEFVLAFVKEAKLFGTNEGGWIILSLNTDGIDGTTDAAGAWASLETLSRMEEMCFDTEPFLANNDSYHFFKRIGGLIKTGPTQTNVMDLRMLIVQ